MQTRRRRGDAELTPLINVVFLLLIFVVLAGEVVETAPFAVKPPDGADGAAAPADALSVYLGPAGRIFVAGETYLPGDMAGAIAALPGKKPAEVLIEADRAVAAATVIALVETLQKEGIRRIRLVTSAGGG